MSVHRMMASLALAAFAGMVLTGCTLPQPYTGHRVLQTPADTISTYKLAGRLGMTLTEQTPTMTAMHDGRNSVVFFPGPPDRLYVNGQRITALAGTVSRANGMLFFPLEYEYAVRAKLLPLPPPPAVPVVTPPLAPPPPQWVGGLVIVDPGHGGKDPGAISVHGHREKDIVLDAAKVVTDSLARGGLHVRMTREDDRFIELEQRSALANRLRANLFVSIHADSAPNRAATGFTVYVARQPSADSKAAADAIARRLQAAGVSSRGRQEANYRVLVGTTCPAVLVELGYLSNAYEATRLADPAYRQKLAEAVANGIVDYLHPRQALPTARQP